MHSGKPSKCTLSAILPPSVLKLKEYFRPKPRKNAERTPLTHTEVIIAGATSGAVTRAIIQPLDVLKIRFQLQVEPITERNHGSKYRSMYQASVSIFKEEGIRSFWKGHIPAQLLSISFGIVQFWSFNVLNNVAKKHNHFGSKTAAHFICGSVSGATAGIITFPFDIMRTRLVAQYEKEKVYHSIYSGYKHIVRNEGFFALYKGLTPSLLAVVPNIGLQFSIYKFLDRNYKKFIKVEEESYAIVGSAVAGSIAGLISKLLVYPFDLTRKRMQIQGFQQYRTTFGKQFSCGDIIDCTLKIWKYEGASGLFKGGVPSSLKAILTSGLTFAVFEFVCETMLSFKK